MKLGGRPGPAAECEFGAGMGDYRRVSEPHNTPPASPGPASPAAPGASPGGAEQPAARPVIAAAAAKRANASVLGMIIALLVSIAAFLPIVLMNPGPKTDGYRPDINVAEVAQNAAGVAGFSPVAPAVDGFRANYARWESGAASGVPTWQVGYLTPKEAFIGLVQTRQSNPTWLLQQTNSARVTGTRSAGGVDWELRDTGSGEKSMVLVRGGTTVVLTGSAQLAEFSVLAAAVVGEVDAAGPAGATPEPTAGATPAVTPSP